MLTPTETIKVTLDKDVRGGNKTLIGLGANSGLTGAGPRPQLHRQRHRPQPEDREGRRRRGRRDHPAAVAPHLDRPLRSVERPRRHDLGLRRPRRHHARLRRSSPSPGRCSTITRTPASSATLADTTQQAEDTAPDASPTITTCSQRSNSGPRVRWGIAHVFNNHFQDVDRVRRRLAERGDRAGRPQRVRQRHASDRDHAIRIPTPAPCPRTGNKFTPGFTVDIAADRRRRSSLPYSYTPDSADSVLRARLACAGTGKINLRPLVTAGARSASRNSMLPLPPVIGETVSAPTS